MGFAVLAVIVTPAFLFARARLVRTTPAASGHLAEAARELRLRFSEQPELKFTSVELHDSAGAVVALGPVTLVPGDGMGVSATSSQPLANGRYTVSWRTAPADGHATTGKYAFDAAIPAAAPLPRDAVAPGAAVSADVPTADTTPIAHTLAPNAVLQPGTAPNFSTALRWTELVAVLTLVGAVIFRLFVVPAAGLPDPIALEAAERARRLAMGALMLFALATITRLSAQSDLIANAGAIRWAAMQMVVRGTRWGQGWLVGAVGAVAALVGFASARRGRAGWMIAALGVLAIALSEGMTGHAGASTRRLPLAIATDLAHFLGAGGWLGGLTLVLLAGLPALRPMNGAERARAGSRLLRSYHQTAMECVTLVIVTAVIAAWLRLGTLDALWTTAYGRVLLIKLSLVLVVMAFGLYHSRTVVTPDWHDDTKVRFQRTATVELLVGALVVAVTAVLAATALPMT
jgi:copper transport protein